MTRLAQLISQEEGFNVPGSIPSRQHNPGDLRHGPGAHHAPSTLDGIGTYTSDTSGWSDLERQLSLDAARGMDIRTFVTAYAPSVENNSSQYLDYICTGLSLGPDVSLATALLIGAHDEA